MKTRISGYIGIIHANQLTPHDPYHRKFYGSVCQSPDEAFTKVQEAFEKKYFQHKKYTIFVKEVVSKTDHEINLKNILEYAKKAFINKQSFTGVDEEGNLELSFQNPYEKMLEVEDLDEYDVNNIHYGYYSLLNDLKELAEVEESYVLGNTVRYGKN